jgi:photosystem II stability/assembly factor-like uncharacterized protein
MRRFLATLTIISLVVVAAAQTYDPSFFGGLHYRMVGPGRGGRALAVCGVPGQPEKFYFGSVGGGVWETDNAGRTWTPIMDSQPVASIGAIAVAPSDPNVIYVGSGEADMRSDIQQGNGMYKSVDGGKIWTHIGLDDTRQIGKVLIDPKDPNVVYVAALGHQYGPNEMRGVFVTRDGGKTWDKTLYKSPDIGAIDMAMDPTNSNVIFATMWATRRPPWSVYPPSNGPGGGLFKSTDAGRTWTQITGHGFPDFVGRVGITISPADHNRMYACVDTNDPKNGGVYRSDDGGANWTLSDGEERIWRRGWYFCGITADPKNPDVVYVNDTSSYRSTDGGKTFIPFKGAPGGDDNHTLWIYPDDPNRMILATDQGVVISVDYGRTWSSWYNEPIGQFYHVAADNRNPYWIFGAQQDSGGMAVPSRTIHTGISMADWRPIDVGGESDMVAADPLHPGILFGSPGNKEDFETGWHQDMDPTLIDTDEVQRDEWTHPIAVSPANPRAVYTSHQAIFRSGDSGASWKKISPDLTRETETPLANLDPTTAADDQGLARKGVVYWIAPSPVSAPLVWAGTDDGLIWVTHDDGGHWDNVTPRELTPWSKVGIIDASHFDANTAYAAIDRHRVDDNHPYIYRTHDGGKTWTAITNGIPEGQFVNVVREDPERKGLLYAGTDWGIFISFDDGDHWQSFQLNLPTSSVRDIVFQNGDMIVGTHGRAIWILDNPVPLRQLSTEVVSAGAALFKPANAIPFQRAGGFGGGASDEGTPLPPDELKGENPDWGAIFDYYVTSAATPVVFTIADSHGKVIQTLSSADKQRMPNLKQLDIPAYWIHPAPGVEATPGAHRYAWNLKSNDDGNPQVPPGTYTVTMSVNGNHYSQPLVVERDKRIPASDADLDAQFDFIREISAEMKVVDAALAAGNKYLAEHGSAMTADQKARLQDILGIRRGRRGDGGTPDMGGNAGTDVTSLSAIEGHLGSVRGAVGGAPSAPTPHFRKAFEILKQKAAAAMDELNRLTK